MSSVWIKRFFIRWEWEEITLPKLIRFNGKSTTYNYLNNLNKDSHFATKFALTPPPSLIIFLEVDIKLLTTSEVWETGRSQTIYRKLWVLAIQNDSFIFICILRYIFRHAPIIAWKLNLFEDVAQMP